MYRSAIVMCVVLAAACSSCGFLDHYAPREIPDITESERKVLLGCVETTIVSRQEIEQKYHHKGLKLSGTVLDVMDYGSPFCPLRVMLEVTEGRGKNPAECSVWFMATFREWISRLEKGDLLVLVGRLSDMTARGVELRYCELIRIERKGKQIYPPPQAEGEKKPKQ